MASNEIQLMEKLARANCLSYWLEYPASYAGIDFGGKIVVMVGADCGSSAIYFIRQGASKVIAYEKQAMLVKFFHDNFSEYEKQVEWHGEWDSNYPDADIFIMDCEGCEERLDITMLGKYEIAIVAVHSWIANFRGMLMKLLGWKLQYVSDDSKELMFRNR